MSCKLHKVMGFCLFVFLQINPLPKHLNTKKSSNVVSGHCESTQQQNVDESLLNRNSEGKKNNYPHGLFAADVGL